VNNNYDEAAQEKYNNSVPDETNNHIVVIYKNKYYYIRDGLISEDLTLQSLEMISGMKRDEIKDMLQEVWAVKREVTFTEKSTTSIELDEMSIKPVLKIITNPTDKWVHRSDINMDIVNDYKSIFDGILDDIINYVIYSVRTNERRANKLILTGGAGVGKTQFFELMNFVNVSSNEFHDMLRQEKIISVPRAEEMTTKGMLHVDDFEGNIPLQFKAISDVMGIKIAQRGVIDIPAKFIALSSTHTNSLYSIGKELKDRLVHFGIEGELTIENSDAYWKFGKDEYRYQTTLYIRNKILEALEVDDPTVKLKQLKEKYRTTESFVDEVMDNCYTELLSTVKNDNTFGTGYFIQGDSFYVESRKDWRSVCKKVLESQVDDVKLDFRKYLSELTSLASSKQEEFGTRPQNKRGYRLNPVKLPAIEYE